MSDFVAQINEVMSNSPIVSVGFGGTLVVVFSRFLARLEVIFTSRMDNIEHAQRGLSKAVWMLLAEISTAGSFVREEAKRMIERDKQRDEVTAAAERLRQKR